MEGRRALHVLKQQVRELLVPQDHLPHETRLFASKRLDSKLVEKNLRTCVSLAKVTCSEASCQNYV